MKLTHTILEAENEGRPQQSKLSDRPILVLTEPRALDETAAELLAYE